MKRLRTALSMIMLFGLVACGKGEECTPELLKVKTADMTAAVQEVVTKKPEKAAEVMRKLHEITAKYAAAGEQEACKAMDEFMTTIKE